MNFNEITYDDINRLDASSFTVLLRKLLETEVAKLESSCVDKLLVPGRINSADGGVDGEIHLTQVPKTRWLRKRITGFQCKSYDLTPSLVKSEFFESKDGVNIHLRQQIKFIFDSDGEFIFFVGKDYNAKMLDARLEKAKEAIDEINAMNGTDYSYDQFRLLDSNQIAEWVNTNIGVVLFVQKTLGIGRPSSLKNLDQWGMYSDLSGSFFLNEEVTNIMYKIRNEVIVPRKSIRVLGQTGIGKSRLVYETLKDSAVAPLVLYFNITDDIHSIMNFVSTYCKMYDSILVVDNCSFGLYKNLKKEVERTDSRFSLITMDYDLINTNSDEIILKTKYYKNIIPRILIEHYGERINSHSINQIADFAEGNAQMAVLFCSAFIRDQVPLSQSMNDDLIKKLIFGRDQDNSENALRYLVIKVCALFVYHPCVTSRHFGLIEVREFEYYNAQMHFIINRMISEEVTKSKFVEICEFFERSGIMERRGKFLSIRPLPLALRLAEKGWEYFIDNYATSINEIITEMQANGLRTHFIDRMGQIDKARPVVKNFFIESSFFNNPDFMFSEEKSKTMYALVNHFPIEFSKILETALENVQVESIVKAGHLNIYIIRALDRLCQNKNSFNRSVKCLYKIAAHETTGWYINGKEALLGKFQIFLSGSEVDLHQKLELLDYGFESELVTYQELAIQACARGLRTEGLWGLGYDSIKNDKIPLIEFIPNHQDIEEYHNGIIDRLLFYITAGKSTTNSAISVFENSMIELVNFGEWELVKGAILKLKDSGHPLDGAWKKLKVISKRQSVKEPLKQEIISFYENILPTDIASRILLFVDHPDHDSENGEDGFIDLSKKKAVELASELIDSEVPLSEYLNILSQGELRYGFDFGRVIGEKVTSVIDLVDSFLKNLKAIPLQNQNIKVLLGILESRDQQFKHKVFDKVLEDNELLIHSLTIAKYYVSDPERLLKLIGLAESNQIEHSELRHLCVGAYLNQIPVSDLSKLCDKMYLLGDIGKWLVMRLLFQYAVTHSDQFLSYLNILVKAFTNHNYLCYQNQPHGGYVYEMATLLKRCIKETTESSFISKVNEDTISVFSSTNTNPYDYIIAEICEVLIEKDFDCFWTYISPLLIQDGIGALNISSHLGADLSNSINSNKEGILFNSFSLDKIYSWCQNNREMGMLNITRMMPLWTYDENDRPQWHSFALQMIGEFCSERDFFSTLGSHMLSFSWSGSPVSYYEFLFSMVSELKSHSNELVRGWATDTAEQLVQQINYEKIRYEEYLL